MNIFLQVALCVVVFTSVKASTHWVVTEEGKVQEKLESPFAINQPHDLMAFMKQESNYEKMQKIKKVLVIEKKMIEDNEDKDFNLEGNHYKNDEDCIAAGKQLGEFNLYASTLLPLENKEIEVSDYIDFTVGLKGKDKPDCAEIVNLPQGSTVYDSLEGIKNRDFLTLYQAEPILKTTLGDVDNEDDFAHAVTAALKQNTSSWIAYNLATSYWRMKGDAKKAIECSRRAIHFSPTEFRDVALVGLANILHRSHYTVNASVVLENALKISDVSVIHFALGCIYATLGEHEFSADHFEKTLKEQPDLKAAKERLHAVKCQSKLQQKLEAQHESLQRTLKELGAYQEKHHKYVEVYQAIEKMQLSRQEQIDMHFLLMQHVIREGTFDQKLCKFRSDDTDGPIMFCNLPKPNMEPSLEDDELIPNIISGKKKKQKTPEDQRGHVFNSEGTKYAAGDKAGIFQEPEDLGEIEDEVWKNPEWPSEELCAKYSRRTLAWDEYPSTYINAQSRGSSVTELLTNYIGIEYGQSIPQPWDDLNCESLEPICDRTTIDEIPGIRDRHSGPMHKQDEYMKKELVMHVNEGEIVPGEIAHRLNKAIKKSLAEKDKGENLWLLYNYAGLYYRVIGDNLKAVECIRRSLHHTPKQHADVPLVNAANIMYRLGRVNDAKTLLIDALVANDTEPLTYLALGNVYQAKGNISGAAALYEYGLTLNSQSRQLFYALMNVKCGVMNDKKMREKILGKDIVSKVETGGTSVAGTCRPNDESCKWDSKFSETIDKVKQSAEFVYKTEDTGLGTEMYMMHTFKSGESKVTTPECENVSGENDLVRRLELTKEDADRILTDADNVIQKLSSNAAKDDNEKLSDRVSSARRIMQQLSQMRDSLGSLVEEASSTLDSSPSQGKLVVSIKDSFTASECVHALHNVDLRSYLSSNMDVSVRGYNFGEELPSSDVKPQGPKEPFCFPPSSPSQYNIDDLETVVKRASFVEYDEEYGMELLLKQLIPSSSGEKDFNILVQRLAQGMREHPKSWRLAFFVIILLEI